MFHRRDSSIVNARQGVVRVFLPVMMILLAFTVRGQQSVFQLFRDPGGRGDAYFAEGSYGHALAAYRGTAKQNPADAAAKMALCYYHLHDYQQAVRNFREALGLRRILSSQEQFVYAESLTSTGQYSAAIEQYESLLRAKPDDEIVQAKIWRLKNAQFLYEDSLHYALRKLSVNSENHELAAVPYGDGLVFVSDMSGALTFDSPDAVTGRNPYSLYFAPVVRDALGQFVENYGRPTRFSPLDGRDHSGPLCFFANQDSVVFSRASSLRGSRRKTLQLFFAGRNGKSWSDGMPYPFNSSEYNLSDPWISPKGDVLYFSSDMKGGYGGKDIYRSEYRSGKWSRPENLGSSINTAFDEVSPHFDRGHFYFSSNGHAGLGGLDVFKAPYTDGGLGELSNMGFPLNSIGDDFAFFFRPDGEGAFLTSNRGGASDDLYEVDIDVQIYPVVISGTLRAKGFSQSDSSLLTLLPSAKLYLIDHSREMIVDEVTTDGEGRFQLKIPYFSQYKIRVVEENGAQSIVSLYIPRQKKADYNHEIVVVKSAFHTQRE